VTIPAEFRRALGIEDDSLLHMSLEDGELRLRPVRLTGETPGSAWLRALYDEFSSVREEAQSMSEEEVNEAIDRSVRAVRASPSS
jgi:bifunctional DNA-binding transcriptional regulator/antitoxin component of YhaV-PrlF toxin-antitoxin module